MTYTQIVSHLARRADPQRSASAQGFFKTKVGDYGEGDLFIGIRVPDLRKVAKE